MSGLHAKKLPKAVRCDVFVLRDGSRARHLLQCDALEDAKAGSLVHLQHKDDLFIHEQNSASRTGILHAFKVRKGAAKWVRGNSGDAKRIEPLKLDKQFSLGVKAFDPQLMFDAFEDDPVGVDRTLVEQAT